MLRWLFDTWHRLMSTRHCSGHPPDQATLCHHANTGNCLKCQDIFDTYPDFNEDLRQWFTVVQQTYPDAHISAAGRGKIAQDADFANHVSRAKYGQSSHNYNCAIDIFQLLSNGSVSYDENWFAKVVGGKLDSWNKRADLPKLEWYGAAGAVYYERPHLEVKGWYELAKAGKIKLVEPI